MTVAGAGENSGTEQAHLNNVANAHLRITALRASSGPGIELLEYLTPRTGRPLPRDQRANDLAHWQTQLVAPDAGRAAAMLRRRTVRFISPRVIDVPEDGLGFDRGILVRDPDGHAMEVIQP